MLNVVGTLTGLLLFTAVVAMKASRYRNASDLRSSTRASQSDENDDSLTNEAGH